MLTKTMQNQLLNIFRNIPMVSIPMKKIKCLFHCVFKKFPMKIIM